MVEEIELDDPATVVRLARSARARRITLTVPQNGDPPRVTAPPSARLPEIRMFLLRQSDWLRGALERRAEPVLVRDGAELPVEGRRLRIKHQDGPRRAPFISDDTLVVIGRGAPGPRIAAWLKELARERLAPVIADASAALNAAPGALRLRDTKGRWGSCTSRGDLSFSWRLAMAPPEVLDYVAVHEAAHLLEMNHGPAFWAHVERLRPDWRLRRDWLKREGGALHLYKFDATG